MIITEPLWNRTFPRVVQGKEIQTQWSLLYQARLYRHHAQPASQGENFILPLQQLPLQVPDKDIEEMFSYADKDGDGKINWSEFQVMINPPKPKEPEKPTLADLEQRIHSERQSSSLSIKKVLSGNIESSWTPVNTSQVMANNCSSLAEGRRIVDFNLSVKHRCSFSITIYLWSSPLTKVKFIYLCQNSSFLIEYND